LVQACLRLHAGQIHMGGWCCRPAFRLAGRWHQDFPTYWLCSSDAACYQITLDSLFCMVSATFQGLTSNKLTFTWKIKWKYKLITLKFYLIERVCLHVSLSWRCFDRTQRPRCVQSSTFCTSWSEQLHTWLQVFSALFCGLFYVSTGRDPVLVLCGWEGNRKSDMSLAMRHRICDIWLHKGK